MKCCEHQTSFKLCPGRHLIFYVSGGSIKPWLDYLACGFEDLRFQMVWILACMAADRACRIEEFPGQIRIVESDIERAVRFAEKEGLL